MNRTHGIVPKYGRRGVGDYPDKIEGYLGCPPGYAGSSLKVGQL